MSETAYIAGLWGPAREYALMGMRRAGLGQEIPSILPVVEVAAIARVPHAAAGPFSGAPRPVPVRIAGLYAPPPLAGVVLSQPFVEIKPQVSVPVSAPITVELGGLPVTVGLLAGSGIAFLVRSGLPEGWPQTVTAVIGAGLAVAGVVNIFLPKRAGGGAPPAPAGPPPPPPSGAAPPEAAPPPFRPPSPAAFNTLQFEVVSPKPGQEVRHLGWFLTGDRIPAVLRMYNPSGEATTFNLEFEWDENPSVAGYNLSPERSSKAFEVTVGPNEELNRQFELPIKTSGAWTSMAVALAVYKKRTPAENRFLVVNITFDVS